MRDKYDFIDKYNVTQQIINKVPYIIYKKKKKVVYIIYICDI